MDASLQSAAHLHNRVPPDWYYKTLKKSKLHKYWHLVRFREVKKVIKKVDGKILDIGSADGMFTHEILRASGANKIIGIDVLKTSVGWAKKHWKRNKKMQFKVGNAHKLQFKPGEFDAVFALEVLEHVPEPEKVFKEIKRVLKKGGYAVVLVPTENILFKVVWSVWTKYGPSHIWDDCHIQAFDSANTLASNLEKIGFEVEVDKRFLLGMLNVVRVVKK